jgi:AsmA family protein
LGSVFSYVRSGSADYAEIGDGAYITRHATSGRSMSSAVVEQPPTRVDPPATRGRRLLSRVLLAIVALLVAIVVAVLVLPSSVWKRVLTHVATADLGRKVSIDGNLEAHLFSWNPRLIVEGLRIDNADWAPRRPMLTVRRLDVSLSLRSVLASQLVFPRVEIDAPDIDLERDSASRANWDFSTPGAAKPQKPGASPPARIPVIQQFILNEGTLTANDRVRKLKFDGQITVDEKQRSADQTALRVRGSGMLNGKPFDLRLDGGPLINTDHSKPYGFDAAVTAADIKLTAHTDIQHPFDLGAVTSKFHLTGKDLADAFYLTGLALPNTPPYDLAGTAVRDGMKFRVDDFHGRLGGSDISGKLGIDAGRDRPKLSAALTSRVLNLADLAAPLGTQATPERKSQTLSSSEGASSAQHGGAEAKSGDAQSKSEAQAKSDAQAKSAMLLPDADLQVARVRGMDADVMFDAESITTAKLPIKKVHFHLILDDGKLELTPLEFTLPEGQFSGSVTLNARPAVPVTDIDMRLKNLDLTQFKPSSSNTAPLSGDLVGRIKLHGTGTSVHKAAADAGGDITIVVPKGEMRAAFAELTGINVASGLGLLLTKKEENTAIRCAVMSFHADHGNLNATTLVVDTSRVLITGSGGVDLGTEGLALSLRGQPKGFRLVRLRSPIKIHGSLSHPQIALQTGNLIGQAGGAIALGALLTPVAALLAFVDAGLAKDANCAELIAQAQQGKDLPAVN